MDCIQGSKSWHSSSWPSVSDSSRSTLPDAILVLNPWILLPHFRRDSYGTWHKLLTWFRSFLQFSRASRHLRRDRTPSAYYPRGFRGRLCNGFAHFRLRWFQTIWGRWEIRSDFGALRDSLLKTIFNLNLTFETKNRLRQTAFLNASNFPTTLERTGRRVKTANTMNSSLRTQSFWTTC